MKRKQSGRAKLLPVLLALFMLLEITACGAAQSAEPSANQMETSSVALSAATPSSFTDVPDGAWYAEAVEYCRQHGIMNGISDTTFAPESSLTRAMLAAVLYRMEGSPAVSGTADFRDVQAGTWYSSAVAWAAEKEIINGYGNGFFGVDDPTTREQAIAILWRYAGNPESNGTADLSDAAHVSDWARAAVNWADANGILDGMAENRRFNPAANIKRGEVASMLYHYLSNSASSQPQPETGSKTLVACFSATNTTRPLAEYAADILNADLI